MFDLEIQILSVYRVFVFPSLRLFAWAPALAPNLYLPVLAYSFIASAGPEFAYTDLVSSLCICIYGPGPRFVLSVPGPEFAFSLLVVIAVIVEVAISLE